MPRHPNLRDPDDVLRGDEVDVRIDKGRVFQGEVFNDWLSLEIRRTLGAVAGSFRMGVASKRPWPLRPETRVTITVAGEPLLDGFVDRLESTADAGGKGLSFAGRDSTAQLADCSAIHEPGEWNNRTLVEIAEELAEPFGVGIETLGLIGETDRDRFDVFALQTGEKAWTAIERMTRLRALLVWSRGDGKLEIGKPGRFFSNTPLVEGEEGNVLSSKVSWTNQDRFATYVVRGQAAGNDQGWGGVVLQPEGSAADVEIERYRPLLILAEGQISGEDAQARAEWEAANRLARAVRLEVEVAGWRKSRRVPEETGSQTELELWRVNERVPVLIPSQGIDATLLVDDVRFTRSNDGGTKTKLRLVREDAFDPKPEITEEKNPLDGWLGEYEGDEEGG